MSGIVVGLVGKLPAHGDFVRRGSPAAAAFLDEWLAGELARLPDAERRALLEGLPLWMFAAVGTPVGDLAGVLCASHDRVGRLFPLAVFVEGAEPAALIGWATAIGDMLAGISPDITADALFDALGAVDAPPSGDAAQPAGSLWWRSPDREDAVLFAAMPTGAELALFAQEPV